MSLDSSKNITVTRVFERVQVDLIDMKQFSQLNDQYNWIFTCIDMYSKFAIAEPLKTKSATDMVNVFRKIVNRHGRPQIIQSDNGTEFTASAVKQFLSERNIQQVFSLPRHLQSQGQVTRFNQTLTRILSKLTYGKEKRWIDHISDALYGYNNTIHSATKKKPFEVFFGRPAEYNCVADVKALEHFVNDVESGSGPPNDEDCFTSSVDSPCSARIRRNRSVHASKDAYFKGDKVLLKKDHGNSSKNRKSKLDGFFEKDNFIVEEVCSNNFLMIRNATTDEVMKVRANKVKKFNATEKT